MRLAATPEGLSLRLDGGESASEVAELLTRAPEMDLEVEFCGEVAGETVAALLRAAGDRRVTFRPPRVPRQGPASRVVAQTVRSGQRVTAEGTLVVLGDVNPGGEVVAGGDVIVVGKLRGLAHAGARGDRGAAIWALAIEAKQLRIADLVARLPEDEPPSDVPERAVVRGDEIVLEPWGKNPF